MPRYFDNYLPQVNSDKIKPMLKMWGGVSTKMTKYDCIDFIVAALKDPQKVREAIDRLEPWERNALALIKRMGGSLSSETLKVSLLASGFSPNRTYRHRDEFAESLIRRGLVLRLDSSNPGYVSTYSYSREEVMLYSDDRLIAQVGLPEYKPFDIQPVEIPGKTHSRTPTTVILDIMGMLQTIDTLGGLKITQNGTVRVSDETKLRRAMRWDEDSMEVDGFVFPNPSRAWIEAFSVSNLLKITDSSQLVLAETPVQFSQRPLGEQIGLILEGLIRTQNWAETSTGQNIYGGSASRRTARLALTLALAALPPSPDGFFHFGHFEQALFKRIGFTFSLNYIPREPVFYSNETDTQKLQQMAQWQETIRANWAKNEVQWFGKALTTWLYFLGLVELVVDNGQLVGFRLTELGRETFHPELASDKPAEPAAQPSWVIQPNFDIIAYLDRVSAPQLAFLERCAERTETHKHTAHYRLTRESVYRGLESGLSPEDLLKNLQIGSQTELSQNIQVELREWASLRERILLRRKARLVEFSSAQALKAELAQGLTGSVVAERFLLLDSAPPVSGWHTINYAQNLPPNLTITETGLIHWKPTLSHDLMTAAQLTQWAEPTPEGDWQLTYASVTSAIKPGKKLSELLILLQNRVFPNVIIRKYEPIPPAIPPLLELALRAWAGTKYPVELETVILLRCPHEKVFQAVIASPLMKSLLKGYLDPDLLLVDPSQLEALRQRLDWLGWKVSDQLQVIPLGSRPS